jgi:hypothetical protein
MFTLISAAVEMPCTERAIASGHRPSASAQAADETRKPSNPPRHTRRGPSQSPSAANGSSSATMASW